MKDGECPCCGFKGQKMVTARFRGQEVNKFVCANYECRVERFHDELDL